MPAPKKQDFAKLMAELEAIVAWFERDDVDLDEALPKFERGMQLASDLRQHLEVAENKVEEIKRKFAQAEPAPTDTAAHKKDAPKPQSDAAQKGPGLF